MLTKTAALPIGTRVMVCNPENTDVGDWGYAEGWFGLKGVVVETDHSIVAWNASQIVCDNGKTRAFWDKHLKVLQPEGRNKL